MKLAVIGGGSVRAPLFVNSAIRRAEAAHLDTICLMDIDADRLSLMGGVCRQIARRMESRVRVETTTDPRAALGGADYIVTAIRVGNEAGRVADERIALRRGVLGQETTGAGGFAMAMRSIPAILEYAELARELAPRAWIFNFTNPAGLVVQALHARGFHNAIGICDSANQGQHDAAKWLGVDPPRLRAEVFGLNHLSWTRRILLEAKDVLPELLGDAKFCAESHLNVFDADLVRLAGMYLNEYLYYYDYAERALNQIQTDPRTRGEEVLALNQGLFRTLGDPAIRDDAEASLRAYTAYQRRRGATYMHYAQPGGLTMEQADRTDYGALPSALEEGEGYAGVALDIISALETGESLYTALNVPNQGAIDGMQSDDVVEVSCVVSGGKVAPLRIGTVPTPEASLIARVKTYERLAVEAILTRSRSLAVQALMAHPLVLSYSRASALVDDYLQAHAAYTRDWR